MHNEEEKKGSQDHFGFSNVAKNKVEDYTAKEEEVDEEYSDIEEYSPSMN